MRHLLAISFVIALSFCPLEVSAQSWGQLKSAAQEAQSSKKFSEATEFWLKAMDACDDKTGPRYIQSLAGLARCYNDQDKASDAEGTYKKILDLTKADNVGTDQKSALTDYVALLRKQKRESDASELEKKFALGANTQDSNSQGLNTAGSNASGSNASGSNTSGSNTGSASASLQPVTKANDEYNKAIASRQAFLVAASKEQAQKHYPQAEQLLKQALSASEKLGDNSSMIADCLNRLITLYYAQDKFQLAEPYYKRSLSITQKTSGSNSRDYANALNGHGQLLRKLNRKSEAMAEEARADEIMSRASSGGSGSSSQFPTQGSDTSATRHGSVIQRAGAAQRGFNRDSNAALDDN